VPEIVTGSPLAKEECQLSLDASGAPRRRLEPLFTTSRGGFAMAARKKSSGKRKYGKAASKRVESAMRRRKKGTLKSGKGGKGGKVTSRTQAIAIGLSEARKKGAKVPRKPSK
jgi:hypothetical protein